MDINDLTIGQARELAAMFPQTQAPAVDLFKDLIGKYVIVRCRDAGVHAGYLEAAADRGCTLTQSRRLWYWKPSNGAKFLSGVATQGLDASSKVGEAVDRIVLTEDCEIIQCCDSAADIIRKVAPNA